MSFDTTARAAQPGHRRTGIVLGAVAVCLSMALTGGVLTATSAFASTSSQSDIVLHVGADETQRNFSWYSAGNTAQVAQVALAANVVDGAFPGLATSISATGGLTTSGEYNRFATVSGLTENTAYVYRVGSEGDWSNTYSFRTQDFDGDFNFLFFGDPQIGSSKDIPGDTAGWTDTLNVATDTYPDAELLFSAGDQVDSAANETQYSAFLEPDQLREIPFVATNGNHDVGSKAYEQHFNTPNVDATSGAGSDTASGGNYWFIYKDVLFLDINSNSRDNDSHIAWMNKIVAEHGDEAKWKVLAFHHSIYSPAVHATDTDIIDRRSVLPTAISDLGIDVVLQGHDHAYARSYLLHNGEKANAEEEAGADSVIAGPGGVLYVTANSASGSKYYNLQAQGFSYLSASNQEKVRNYSAIEVTDDAFTIKTLRSQAYGDANPVNSVVDQVTLTRETLPDTDAQELQVIVPEAAPGEFVWNIDGTNGILDLGTAVDAGDHFSAVGSINAIRVTDTRPTGSAWSVSAQVGDFTSGAKSFSGRYLGWSPSVVETGGDAVAGAPVSSGFFEGDGLSVSSTLGYAANGHSLGSAKLDAGLGLSVPVDVTDGTYKATLTLTALS
ncbi:metallophosphoesterase [Cryobacterium frigoriphilum]|uniref:Metallophosphoesterase n=1 Tax=Cryobacterium frigoriphilum TaxID=1259150 RepID=A0A4R9ACX4_9MICO|nr:fibronectin type III domain-containing protein [Cryobacterium frigoriphilum]TFD56128.1 metallophosphoesterase [Cryobacterium frigoriphilum]